MKSRIEAEPINLGFQIAPMIDIVFVIMLFFMVMAGGMKAERRIRMALPGTTISENFGAQPVEEVIIAIDEDGVVAVNEEEIGTPADAKLDALSSLLVRLRENAGRDGTKMLATLQTDPATPYQRVMDVMNALARAKVVNMTFTVGED